MKNVNYTALYVQTQSVLQNGNESKIINHFISRLNSASNVQNHYISQKILKLNELYFEGKKGLETTYLPCSSFKVKVAA